MGILQYDAVGEFEFDDRVLAHVKSAVGAKLRRRESFFLNWSYPANAGSGRVSLWISPTIPLVFRFAGNTSPQLNSQWTKLLIELANTPQGMTLVREEQVDAALTALGTH